MASYESRDPEETMCEIWRTQVEYFVRKSNLQKGKQNVNQEPAARWRFADCTECRKTTVDIESAGHVSVDSLQTPS